MSDFPGCKTVDLEAGEPLVVRGQPCDSIYLVLRGELEVWTETARQTTRVIRLEAGGVFGDESQRAGASVTVRAGEPCRLLEMDIDAFMLVLAEQTLELACDGVEPDLVFDSSAEVSL